MANNLQGSFKATLAFGADGSKKLELQSTDLSSKPLKFEMTQDKPPTIPIDDFVNWVKKDMASLGFTAVPDGIKSDTQVEIKTLEVSTDQTFDLEANLIFGNGEGWSILPGVFKLESVGLEIKSTSDGNL